MKAAPKEEYINALRKEEEEILEQRDKLVYQLAENEMQLRRIQNDLREAG